MEVKHGLIKPPELQLADSKGRFHLYSDMSMFATGSSLYQIQNGKPKKIAYASKRLPEAARNYSITELVMYGLAINIASLTHLLKRVDFDAIVDHLALTNIIKSKAEPAMTRIKRLLELFSSYSFNLYHIKENDDRNLHEIIPILFNMQSLLQTRYYNIGEGNAGKYLVQTWSQAKSSRIRHGLKQSLAGSNYQKYTA